MGTPSKIGYIDKTGEVRAVYAHWDGYLNYNGTLLLNKYSNNETNIKEWIDNIADSKSYIISLRETPDKTTYRDTDSNSRHYSSIEDFMLSNDNKFIQYIYLYDIEKQHWFYNDGWQNYPSNKPSPDSFVVNQNGEKIEGIVFKTVTNNKDEEQSYYFKPFPVEQISEKEFNEELNRILEKSETSAEVYEEMHKWYCDQQGKELLNYLKKNSREADSSWGELNYEEVKDLAQKNRFVNENKFKNKLKI